MNDLKIVQQALCIINSMYPLTYCRVVLFSDGSFRFKCQDDTNLPEDLFDADNTSFDGLLEFCKKLVISEGYVAIPDTIKTAEDFQVWLKGSTNEDTNTKTD